MKKQNNKDDVKINKRRITSNYLRPDYYWLERAIWNILENHQEQIIKEVTELISKADKDRTLA